jgi:23S rRNA pseudouridine2605 synthase
VILTGARRSSASSATLGASFPSGGSPSDDALRLLGSGVELDDGPTAPARVRVLRRQGETTVLELAIHEGRKHQVKRMCAAVGHPVRRLHRSRYAGLDVEGLRRGDWRELTPAEVDALRRRAGSQLASA